MGDGNVIVFNNTSLPETFTYSYPYCENTQSFLQSLTLKDAGMTPSA